MGVPELTIWSKSLDGYWNPIGSDLGVEVIPESWTHERVAQGGPSVASFQLQRDTRVNWSDLGAFTPIYVEIGGVRCWSGRIIATPKQRGTSSVWDVQCEGWYAHMNDDLTNKGFVHRGWAGWRNITDRGTSAVWDQACVVSLAEFGYTKFHVPTGNTLTNGQAARVYFDAGPDNTIERVVLNYRGGGAANLSFQYRADIDDPEGADEAGDIDTAPVTTSLTTFDVTLTTPCRFFSLQAKADGANVTGATTAWVRIEDIQVFVNSAYESSNTSILLLSDVLKDDLTNTCPLISSDHSLIEDSSNVITHYWPDDHQTPRERLESLMPYEAQQFSFSPAPVPLPVLRALPTVPVWVYDAATDGGAYTDGGANDGQETYNQALVTYHTTGGTKTASKTRAGTSAIAFTNPGFETNTTGWSAGALSAIARSTLYKTIGSASLELKSSSTASTVSFSTSSLSANLKAGRTYTLSFWMTVDSTFTGPVSQFALSVDHGGASPDTLEFDGLEFPDIPVSPYWQKISLTFVAARSGGLTVTCSWSNTAWSFDTFIPAGYFDEFTIVEDSDTLIDRRGFTRTKQLDTDVTLTAGATALASNFLDRAQYPPFKGSLNLIGYARKHGTDEYIPVSQLPEGDVLLVMNETDIVTGGIGRAGVISRVAYTHNSLSADVDLDSHEDIIDQLLGG